MRVSVLAVAVLAVTVSAARAEQRYQLDLARHAGPEVTAPVAEGPVTVVVTNQIPGRAYTYAVSREWIPIPPLSMPANVSIPVGAAADPECVMLVADYDKIVKPAPTSETDVPAKAKALAELVDSDRFKNKCLDDTIRRPIRETLQRFNTPQVLGPFGVDSGQQLRVTVQRLADSGAVEKTWTTVLSAGSRGEWLTTYGMTFVRNDNQRFYAKPGTEANKFVITPERESEKREVSFIPAVMFSWVPSDQRGRYVTFSPTAGVGATSDTFAVLVGGTATVNLNLGFTLGVAFSNHQRLSGKYVPGQTVSENLTEAQLHRNAKLPAVFFAATLRFGQSPFGTAPKPAAPAPAPAAPPSSGTPAAPAAPAVPPAAPAAPPVGGAAPAGGGPAPGAVPAPAPGD
jgi:hypothetical protein